MNAVTWVHSPFMPGSSGLMIDQKSSTSIFGFISMGRSSSSSIMPGIMTCRIRPSRPDSAAAPQHFVRVFQGLLATTVHVRRHELERDGI